MRIATAVAAVLAGLAVSVPASAQSPPSPNKPGLDAYAVIDANSMAASQSFKAVVGSSTVLAFGGGIDITHITGGLFARIAYSTRSVDGSRAFAVQNSDGSFSVFSLNIPVTVTMRPLELGAGWAFGSARGPMRMVPYVGGGFLLLHYAETSPIATAGENFAKNGRGELAFGGLNVVLLHKLLVGAEVQYRHVPNVLGAGGVSATFGETDLGGVTVRLRIGVSLK